VASLFISLDSIISAFFFKLPTLVFLNSNYPLLLLFFTWTCFAYLIYANNW
jgi:hypothetical protein